MSVIWVGEVKQEITEADLKFLRSVHISDSGHEAFVRDYGNRRKSNDLVGLSMLALACAGAVGLMLWWSL